MDQQKPTLKELQKSVIHHVAPKWEDLGIQLSLDDDGSLIDSISEKRGRDEAKCCLDVLKAWLQGKGEEPKTWRTLVDCLREIKAEEAIRSIEKDILKVTERDRKPTLKGLQNYVVHHVATKWEELGIELDLDEDGRLLDSISERRGGDEAKCCLDVLKAWLQGKGEEPKTWRTLVDCLREIRTDECHEAIKSIEENLLQNTLATSPSQLSSAAEPSQLQEIASPTLLPQASEPAAINYKLKPEPGKQIRGYQWELAEPGINGENYIICAPTGTGKTLVAGLIISEHLQQRKLDGKPGKVVFMVNTKPLAQQQMGELQKMIPRAFVKCCTGDDAGLATIQMLLKDEDVIVCTAGKLLNELNDAKVCLNEISLIVIDECHHTRKDTPYARVMRCYLEEKQIGKGELPQVVGLTASPGAGENPRLDLDKTLHHLTSLCALMDATSGIKTVVENIEELEKHTNKPTFRLQILPCRDRSEAFIAEITKQMASLGNLVDLRCPFPQWSQQYETAIQQKKQPLEMDSSPKHRDAINTLKLLRCFSQTLNIYMDLRYEDAIAVLHQFTDLPTEEQATSREKELIRSLEYLKSELAKLPKEPNPLLIQVEEKLLSHFSKKPESKGICFVRTKKHAHAICEWISKLSSESGVEIHPKEFVGHTRETGPGMTQVDQEDVMKGFQEGKYNLLVATSVAEEGLDVPACNLVIRFQHVSNEIARKQTLGRARAAESEGYTILSNDSKKSLQEIKNKDLDALVTEALQYLPIGEPLQKIVTKQQEEIVQKLNLKKQLSKRRVSEGADRDSIKLKCKVCKTLACKGSDIYKAESNYVVADEDFRENKIRIEKFHSPMMYSENSKIARSGRIYCKGCDTEWGGMCVWPSAGYELPILKCKYFIFEIRDSPRPVRKWSEAPFDIPQLSSHPQYQGLED